MNKKYAVLYEINPETGKPKLYELLTTGGMSMAQVDKDKGVPHGSVQWAVEKSALFTPDMRWDIKRERTHWRYRRARPKI